MGDISEEEKKRRYLERIDNDIEDFGFHVTYVMEEKDFTPFGYSTGLYKNFGIPEAFISGLPNGLTNTLINNYADTFKNRKIPFFEKLTTLIDRFPVYIIPVKSLKLKNHTLASFRLYNDSKFESIQIIFPDLNGVFPEEDGYNYDQKIFGPIKKNSA